MRILEGRTLSTMIKEQLQQEVIFLSQRGFRPPSLAAVVVGNDARSKHFVKKKGEACASVGINSHLIFLPEQTSQQALINEIHQLNNDSDIDAILVQLPLPEHFQKLAVLEALHELKDVDGLHPLNTGKFSCGQDVIVPCTPKGVLSLLQYNQISVKGKHVVIIGRSDLVGKPMAQLLLRENATVTICHSFTPHLENYTKTADILISAVGEAGLITPTMLKKGVVVVDIGISYVNGCLVGDVYNKERIADFQGIVDAITPVPGGVGPMTIVSLLQNCVEIYEKNYL